MTELLQHWRLGQPRNIFRRRGLNARRTPRRTIRLVPNAMGLEHSINLDVSYFGDPLPVHEILLEPPKPAEVVHPWPRDALIPGAPPLPTREMLLSVARSLNPRHISPANTSPTILDDDTSDSISPPEIVDTNTNSLDNLITCAVCMEPRELEQFPTDQLTDLCFHPNYTCLTCLELSIASDHATKIWDNIQCPQCCHPLSYEAVKKYADPDTFAHYDALATNRALSNLDDFVWCTACPSGQFHSAPAQSFSSNPKPDSKPSHCPEVSCNSCSAKTCFNHRIPYHTGITCAQYDRLSNPSSLTYFFALFNPTTLTNLRSTATSPSSPTSKPTINTPTTTQTKAAILARARLSKASTRGIARECKKCPGANCGAMIYKIDGCKHMTCVVCAEEFCWGCGRDWFYGHKCWKFWRTQEAL